MLKVKDIIAYLQNLPQEEYLLVCPEHQLPQFIGSDSVGDMFSTTPTCHYSSEKN